MTDRIRIAVVDDHPIFRAGVVQTLAENEDFEVVGQGTTADDAVRIAKQAHPEILLLDLDIPGGGMQALAAISESCPATRVVMLTASGNEDYLAQALRVGARGYVLKGVGGRELIHILRGVQDGTAYVTPSLAANVLLQITGAAPRSRTSATSERRFTPREREILESLAAGLSNREIGEKIHLGEKTVKHYMTGLMRKIEVKNRVEAALFAQRHGFVKK